MIELDDQTRGLDLEGLWEGVEGGARNERIIGETTM